MSDDLKKSHTYYEQQAGAELAIRHARAELQSRLDVEFDQQLVERTAQLVAHRACTGAEHDPSKGKLHGDCVVCGVPWPCEYASRPPKNDNSQRGTMHVYRIKATRYYEGEETIATFYVIAPGVLGAIDRWHQVKRLDVRDEPESVVCLGEAILPDDGEPS